MKGFLGLIAIAALASLIVCNIAYRLAAPQRQRASFEQVQVGMTTEKVVSLMGQPDSELDLRLLGAMPDSLFLRLTSELPKGTERVLYWHVLDGDPDTRARYRPAFAVFFDERGTVIVTLEGKTAGSCGIRREFRAHFPFPSD
jgi:hypothetical protein